ncbi:MAG: pentapeptide repeat-containing protein [Alphaproteobacteria bacterium]|nr:pentapeptide repeat-containing protein [Alphaproteobacteria bacterium]
MRWWAQGWDWESLKTRKCPHPDYSTYAEYYEKTSKEITFPDPRIEENPPLITEAEYWGSRWLTNFPKGSVKFWDPYHLPTIEPFGGRSPKHLIRGNEDRWFDTDREALLRGLKARAKNGQPRRKDDWTAILSGGTRLAPLQGVVIPGKSDLRISGDVVYVDFGSSLFGEECKFSSLGSVEGDQKPTFFGDNSTFENSLIGHNVDFTGAVFEGTVSFAAALFGEWAEFSDTNFEKVANFEKATFTGIANFDGATFGVSGIFRSATFRSIAGFNCTLFNEYAVFENTAFYGLVAFQWAAILGAADFSWTPKEEESDDTYLSRQNYSGSMPELMFRETHIWGNADFSNRTFVSRSDFSGTRFLACPSFHGASLHENTTFTHNTHFSTPPCHETSQTIIVYKKRLGIAESEVASTAEDMNRSRIALSECNEDVAGDYVVLQAEHDQAMQDAEAALKKVRRLKLQIRQINFASQRRNSLIEEYTKSRRSPLNSDREQWSERCQDYEQAYRRLKILMKQQEARNEELQFYTLEIKSRMLRRDVPRSEKSAAWLYGFTSNYGQSVQRPLLFALFGWPLIIFALLFFLTTCFQPGVAGGDAASHSLFFVVRNIIPGLSLREALQGCSFESCYQLRYQEWIDGFIAAGSGIRFLFYLIAVLYSAVSLALWFLFALALKRRFQIG